MEFYVFNLWIDKRTGNNNLFRQNVNKLKRKFNKKGVPSRSYDCKAINQNISLWLIDPFFVILLRK